MSKNVKVAILNSVLDKKFLIKLKFEGVYFLKKATSPF